MCAKLCIYGGSAVGGSRNPEGGEAEAEERRAAGRGNSTERVTEGKLGEYGRSGARWKWLSEGRLYKDVDDTCHQWGYRLSLIPGRTPEADGG